MSPTGVVERPTELPQVDPRMRNRWVRARREEGRRRLRLLSGLAIVAVVAGAAVGIAESPLLAVRHVTVRGDTQETTAQVVAVAGLGSHPAMIRYNTGLAAHHLEAMPWVSSARVSRQWPNSVNIEITERNAVAVLPVTPGLNPATTLSAVVAGSPTLLVDATGRVLGPATGAVPGLPVIVGAPAPGTPGPWVPGTVSGARQASLSTPLDSVLELAGELPPSLSSYVVSLQIDADGTLSGELAVPSTPTSESSDNGGVSASSGVQVPVVFGDSTDLPAKIVALQTLMANVGLSRVTKIDVSDSQRLNLTGDPLPVSVSPIAGG